LVNDNSGDATEEIAAEYGCHVVNIKDGRGPRERGSPAIAEVFNVGLARVSRDSDYAMILGADHILPRDYVDKVIGHMESDRVDLASGLIRGEPTETPRGSGRIVSIPAWLRAIGRLAYPLAYGFETYLPLKLQMEGHEIRVYRDVSSKVQRATGSATNYVAYGRGMKFLGYTPEYALARAFVAAAKFNDPAKAVQALAGYLSYPYRSDVADYLSRTQRELLMQYACSPKRLVRRIMRSLKP
jgi:hypothetical protein